MSFITPYDVANRCLQHLGQPRISTFSDLSMQAAETGFIYDKARRAELRRAVWTFSGRRAVARPNTATTKRVVFATYAAATVYTAGDIVQDSTGYLWLATAGATGTAPGTTGYYPVWVSYCGPIVADTYSGSVAYIPGDLVINSSIVYLCVAAASGQAPPNATYWHPVQGAVGTALLTMTPAGYNPAGTAVRNAYMLPANFMRLAAQDPKVAANAHLSVTAGLKWSDWELEDGVLYTSQTGALVLRFAGDVQDVTRFDDMFCEALAARMAMSLCERFTQSKEKFADIGGAYNTAVATARAMSSIEAGSTEDDFQTAAAPQAGR